MPITPQQVQVAEATQRAAAHDGSQQIRLVAGPGTGKSFSIEERVCWLLGQGIQPRAIMVVSFTRASSVELRSRIHAYCARHNQHNGADVRVSTLHSLALRMLKAANLLHYPADPLVLDSWELENVFDAEFGYANGLGKTRREEIRREHEAFWSTGQWAPPNYIPPDPQSQPRKGRHSTRSTAPARKPIPVYCREKLFGSACSRSSREISIPSLCSISST